MVDIPIASAVIIGHSPEGAQPVLSAAGGLSGPASHRLDYDGRLGRWEEKGGCEREPTEDDERLLADGRERFLAGRQLDYVARLGGFAEKGAGRQVDASYWNQWGPVSRSALEQDMASCGGCFMKSYLAVDRRYAESLGLTRKEDFQRLLRDTWTDAVMKWGVAESPQDVRWFANYHTDADKSLHVHVTTYFAGARKLEEGQRVTALATREAKAVVYREAYASIRVGRDVEQAYYRMLVPELAKAELGLPADPGRRELLENRAREAGAEPPRLERTLEGESLERCMAAWAKAEARLGDGRGRLSGDWKLQSDARAAYDELAARSEPFASALGEYRRLVEQKADLRGLAVRAPSREGDPAAETAARERRRLVGREMDDLKRRCCSQMVKAAGRNLPGREPERRDRAEGRSPARADERAEVGAVARGLLGMAMENQGAALGLSASEHRAFSESLAAVERAVALGARSVDELPDAARVELARAVGRIMASPAVSERIALAARRLGQRCSGRPPSVAELSERTRASLERRAVSRMAAGEQRFVRPGPSRGLGLGDLVADAARALMVEGGAGTRPARQRPGRRRALDGPDAVRGREADGGAA